MLSYLKFFAKYNAKKVSIQVLHVANHCNINIIHVELKQWFSIDRTIWIIHCQDRGKGINTQLTHTRSYCFNSSYKQNISMKIYYPLPKFTFVNSYKWKTDNIATCTPKNWCRLQHLIKNQRLKCLILRKKYI